MDEPLLIDETAASASEEIVRALGGQRETSRRALAQHRERFRGLEDTLNEQLRELDRALTEAHAAPPQSHPVALETERLSEEYEQLTQLRNKIVAQQQAWQAIQDEFTAHHTTLLAQIQVATAEHITAQHACHSAQAEFDERRSQLEAEERELDVQLQQVAAQAALLAQRLADVERRSAAHDEMEGRLYEAYTEQRRAYEQQELDRAERTRQFEDLAELRRQLQAEQDQLRVRQAETQSLRRRVAQELRAQRAEMLADLERRHAEIERLSLGDQAELKHKLLVATAEAERLRDELAERRSTGARDDDEHAELQIQFEELEASARLQRAAADKALAEAQLRLTDAQREKTEAESQALVARSSLAQARDDLDQLRQRLTDARERLDAKEGELNQLRALATERTTATAAIPLETTHELETLRAEREELLAQVERLEGSAVESGEGNAKEVDHLRRRLELALQDIRELKSKNAELETACAKAKSGPRPVAAPSAGPLDWEAQKQRLLAQLEDELTTDDPEQEAARLTIEGTIRLTDEIIAEKERELAEAQRLLAEQSNHLGGMAVGANAIAALLDQDELIRSEREQLKGLQELLQEKLRAAEIELSMERAKIARERGEFREKIAALEAVRDKAGLAAAGEGVDAGKKPNRNRWLSRLGLREGEKPAE